MLAYLDDVPGDQNLEHFFKVRVALQGLDIAGANCTC